MEEQKSIFELELTEEGKSNFSSIAQWAFINAIIGFVALVVTVITTFMLDPKVDDPALRAAAKGSGMFTALVTAVISLLLNITLLNAATNLKKGLTNSDQGYFNYGLLKMAGYFKILGILLIVFIVIFSLFLLIGIMAGASAV